MGQKRILTIQDLSCFGKCSLGAALPVISALGVEAVALPTAILSTHTGEFKNYTFHDLTDEMPKISRHWKSLDIKFDAIYVGYLGSMHQLEIVSELLEMFANNDTVIFVDPVMADNGILYDGFSEEFVKKMAELCKRADVICPNITEACFLTGLEYKEVGVDFKYIRGIIDGLSEFCDSIILTGVGYDEKSCGAVSFKDNKLTEFFGKRIKGNFYGTGDLFAAAFIGKYVNSGSFEEAVGLAEEFVSASILNTIDESEKYWYGVKFEQCLDILINNT